MGNAPSQWADKSSGKPPVAPPVLPAGPLPHGHALCAGALALLLRHEFGGCPHAGGRAADLFERLADEPGLDAETGRLRELMSLRLAERVGVSR